MTESIAFDRDIREGILTIQWAPPANVSKQLKVVYALFTIRRQPNEDSLDGTTVSPHKLELLSITVDRIFESRDAELIVGGNVPKFLVVAMNRNGLVGQAFFPRATAADTFPFGNLLPTTPGAADKPSELNDVRLLVISVCVCAVVCGALLTVFGLFLRHLVRKQRMHRRIGRSYAFKVRKTCN